MANLGLGVVGFWHADDAGVPAAPIVEAGEVWRLIDDNQVLVLVEDQIREFWSLGSTGYGLTHAYKGTKMGWEVEGQRLLRNQPPPLPMLSICLTRVQTFLKYTPSYSSALRKPDVLLAKTWRPILNRCK